MRQSKKPYTPIQHREEAVKRFLKRIQIRGECWIWLGAPNKDGYGSISIEGKARYAHRVAWELFRGPAPKYPFGVLHNCPGGDNPLCVNPLHLWIGTDTQNSHDALEKGRLPWGEQKAQSKLTMKQALKIRNAKRFESLSELGRRYGVSRTLVRYIRTGRQWRHLQ